MTTYYVRPTNGSDAAAGTSFGAAFQTTQKALDTAVGGDDIRLCVEATETTSATIDVDNASFTTGECDIYAASASDGSILTDGTRYVIQASATLANGLIYYQTTTTLRYKWHNIDFDGNSNAAYCIRCSAHDFGTNKFSRCLIHGSTGPGAAYRCPIGLTNQWQFIGCEVYSNSGDGLSATILSGRGATMAYACNVHDNGGDGMELTDDSEVISCIVHSNTGHGIHLSNGGADQCMIFNNTVDANGGSGLHIVTGAINQWVVGNSFTNNGAYGINNVDETYYYVGSNHYYNNTTAETNSATTPGVNNSSGDPLYRGSGDYRFGDGSPLQESAGNNVNKGALGIDPDDVGAASGGSFVISG